MGLASLPETGPLLRAQVRVDAVSARPTTRVRRSRVSGSRFSWNVSVVPTRGQDTDEGARNRVYV